jgi:hypothetical protein
MLQTTQRTGDLNMRRIRAAVLALAMTASGLLAIGVTAAPASANTAVAGKACTQVGLKSTVRSTQYICTKSGSRNLWTVNAKTVRVGRGCTKAGELAEVGSRKVLHSCTSKNRVLVWKAASKECRETVALYNKGRQEYLSTLAQVAAVEAEARKLPPADAANLLVQLATIKSAVETLGDLNKDTKASIPLACSL